MRNCVSDVLPEGSVLPRPSIEIVKAGEIREQCMSYQKAARTLGFKPQAELEEGLGLTVIWYRRGGVWDAVET